MRESQRLCSGRMRAFPITAGDQGDPPGGNDTASSPPGVRDDAGFPLDSSASGPRTTLTCVADAGFTLASSASGPHTTDAGRTTDAGFTLALSASGPRTTPICLAVVVEGTPLRQTNRYAGGITNHLDVQLLAILTDADGKAITPTLTTVLTEYLPPTMASVLEGSLADFRSSFDSTVGADLTLQMQEFLEDATDSRIQDYIAIMTAIEGMYPSLRSGQYDCHL